MKTFEERYTAWIDGELEGNALMAFEQELVRRATVEESRADKADALRLNAFLQDHLQAPVLTNTDFFNHQLRERIDGERAATRRPASREEASVAGRAPLFAWSFWHLAVAGAACLFISGALYYGTIPQNGPGNVPLTSNQSQTTKSVQPGASGAPAVVSSDPARPAVNGNDPMQVASLTKEQQERQRREADLIAEQQKQERQRAQIEPGTDIQAKVPDQTVPATATSLHYKKPDVNVLWVNGLDYLPDASALDEAAVNPATSAAPVPMATP